MVDSKKEKYLGDFIDTSGKIRSTIEDRKNRGYGIVSEILAILDDIPLGQHRMEIGLHLREAMLLNGILFNSEAWHSLSLSEIKTLESVDEQLLRGLVKAHSKTPLEFLYLEAGANPIRFIISTRRMTYLQTILKRSDEELTKRIYNQQKVDPSPGDFYLLVKDDFKMIKQEMNENEIKAISKLSHKNNIKKKVRQSAFEYLTALKQTHSKVKDISYKKLETQTYMMSVLFNNDEVNTLHALRSRSIDCKFNFKQKYLNQSILCPLCEKHIDDQKQMLNCEEISKRLQLNEVVDGSVLYEDIFEDVAKQKVITSLFTKIIEIRKTLLNENLSTPAVLETSNDLQHCIDNMSSGK